MKKICDHLGLDVSIGKPTVFHQRASDPFVNLVKEAPGIALNESFWQEIDAITIAGFKPGFVVSGHPNVFGRIGQMFLIVFYRGE